MTNAECVAIVSGLAASFPQAKIGAENVAAYVRALSDLEAGGCRAACARIVASQAWFPTIATIRDSYFDSAFGFPSQDAAMLELKSNIQSAGQYVGLTKWSHPLLMAAAESVGWWRLANGDNPSADYAQFLKAYDSMRRATITEASLESAGIPSGTPKLPWRAKMPTLPAAGSRNGTA